jgi:hypothetical protein
MEDNVTYQTRAILALDVDDEQPVRLKSHDKTGLPKWVYLLGGGRDLGSASDFEPGSRRTW